MKHLSRLFCFVLVLATVLCGMVVACADGEEYYSPLFDVYDFKFEIHKEGIGLGTCPVYTAPSTDAVRNANGKASVDTRDRVDVAGRSDNGWLLVRYEIKNGWRVGYIPRENSRNYKTNMAFHFSAIPQVAAQRIAVTDSTAKKPQPYTYLEVGTPYTILGKYTYTGNWWYIEFEMDGQPARGFIDRATTLVDRGDGVMTADLGDPPYDKAGNPKLGTIRVKQDSVIVRKDAGTSYDMVARAHLNDVYPVYAVKGEKPWYYIFVDGVWGWIASGLTDGLQ